MSMLLSGQNSWLRYFTELSNGTVSHADAGNEHEIDNEAELDFDTVLQKTIAEYGATRDHLEMLEKKLAKMVEIKEAKARSDYELAKRNLALSEKEAALVRKIVSGGTPGEEDTDTIKGERHKESENPRPLSPEDHPVDDYDKDLPNLSPGERAQALLDELERTRQKLAEEEHARLAAENSLFSAESQSKHEIAHTRMSLKNEEAARLKADAVAAEEAKARYAAEYEIQRLRTELKLVGMDAKQQRGSIPFATGQVEKRDQWLESRSPEELQELQGAVARVLDGSEKRRTLDGTKKRKLSKTHRFRSQSIDVINADPVGNTAQIGLGEAL